MTKFALKLGAAVALVLCGLAGAAQAGGSLDDDDDYGYRRETLSRFCYKHPYDARCDPRPQRYQPRPQTSHGRECEATVRAAGKRNLVTAFARNSALFSWQREVRSVHGEQYSSWGRARRAEIVCGPAGGALKSCVAVATPCRI